MTHQNSYNLNKVNCFETPSIDFYSNAHVARDAARNLPQWPYSKLNVILGSAVKKYFLKLWWPHQMGTFPVLPVTGESPSQRPVTRSFDVFFDLRLNKRLNKQSGCRWFETLSRSLWRQYNALTVPPTTISESRCQLRSVPLWEKLLFKTE